MTQRELLLDLIGRQQRWTAFTNQMAGIRFEVAEIVDMDLADLILDLMGFPPDNTVQQEDLYGYEKSYDRADTFCRDGLYDVLLRADGSPAEILDWLEMQLAQVVMEESRTGAQAWTTAGQSSLRF
jgi:hypothetical protein